MSKSKKPKPKPKRRIRTGMRATNKTGGKRRAKFQHYGRLTDGKQHPVTIRTTDGTDG